MKGQYRILSEILLFTIGVIITVLVLINYQQIQGTVNELALRDNLLSVYDILSTGIIKASETNVVIKLRIPDEISGHVYTISLEGDNLVLASHEDPSINVTKQLFNITQSHNITIVGNILFSSSAYLRIYPINGNITIEEW